MIYPKEIVAALIGTRITNDPDRITRDLSRVTEWLDRPRMQFMAACDFGQRWEDLAKGPTLFCIGEDGKPLPANARQQLVKLKEKP